MTNATFCSLSDENFNSSLVTTKTYRQWNCKNCRDKLDLLYNRTPARTLNKFPQVPEHAIRKELSQEKGSAKCHSPSFYNEESTEVDRAINDLYESTPINQENGSAKYLPPSWGNKEFADANPILNGLDEASPSNLDGTKNMQRDVDFMDDTNPLDTCQRIKEKKYINDQEKLEFLPGKPMLGRSEKGKNEIKTYKRRKNTKVQNNDVYQTPYSSENKLECSKMYFSKVSPGKSEQTMRKTSEHEEDKCVRISIKEASTIVQSEKSNPEFSQLEQQQICHLHNEQPRSTTEDQEDYCVIISADEFLAILQSRKSQNHLSKNGSQNPEFKSVQDQQFLHLHNEVSLGNATEDEEDDCAIASVKRVSSTRHRSGESHNQYNVEKFTSYRDNTNLNGSLPPTMDISAMYQHPQNFSKPVGPVPRIGVPQNFKLQKEVATYSESCQPQSGYRLGMSEEETPWQMYIGENLALSSSRVPANCSPQHLGYATSVAIPEPAREISHSAKGKRKMVDDPSDKSSEQDICACLCLSICGHECCSSWKEFQNTR